MRTENVDVAVVGGGPAGLAAASAASEAGAESVLLIERGERLGGILNQCIHDGFGTKMLGEALTGPEYAQIFIDRLSDAGVISNLDTMVLDLNSDRELTICNEDGIRRVKAGAVVICTGCRERTRGAIRIPGSRPAGVYTAGVVQEYMNMRNILVGRKAVILGSGDIGLIMARRLTLEGVKVECVAEILPHPSGLARNIVQCLDDFDIPLHLSTTVVEIHGTDHLRGITLAQIGPKGGVVRGTKRFIECDTLLLSVGLIPENELAKKAGIELSPVTAGPIVDDQFQTSVPGMFCGGNALQVHDLVDYASMESQKAGQSAAIFAGSGRLPAPSIPVQPGSGIRYVVPQALSGEEAVDFSMRVFNPEEDRYVVFRRDGRVVRRMKQTELDPAAMIRIRVRADRFKDGEGPLTVEVTD
ncbi:MAG: FAD-dependent oxidoreductase [SAR202 cluster bacterium]|jgi:NADPH-dependent 2,4-dienoyl-CoA reductase/sulfur reductase-like enzyme|nr:pyridine nucleotide-disulfide oxidoreductase [Chloroflexota bacterium]MDP6420812.1 FAD-dependent oxidoreductase [SAR202 cluster bacterium]HAL46287.1 pyridine nucleotide-disulfide oxidoreductase [Dehalococcoidia bacterium]MDP6662454.1 FAD-dependent oxidoreductase [SAR202 cluster bacterium]MDP6799783.1 FAD-dependent oxidoreductase [SAR202 cluster bacterium]|tara:strand:+ start:10810 stop:12054 length:1245 start_codon:yes stop_codon:yes gene_type:complete